MAIETFKKGDVVQLKSGGPAMTVLQVEETYVACIWYSTVNGMYMEPKDFPPELLKLSEPDKKPKPGDHSENQKINLAK